MEVLCYNKQTNESFLLFFILSQNLQNIIKRAKHTHTHKVVSFIASYFLFFLS